MIPIGQTDAVQAGLSAAHRNAQPQAATDKQLLDMALKLEASFLAEMLKHAGVGENRSALGGGAGEEQFASFLRQAHAKEIAKSGGIGLAEQLFNAMKEA